MSETPPALPPQSRLRLTGGRYEGAGFPIDGLPELIQYERLVVDVAKALWLRDHAERRRVPRGFSSVIGLRLTSVEEGSAIPVLHRPDVTNTMPEVDPQAVIDQAQDLIDATFREIVDHNSIPVDFPPGLTSHFLRLGRTLQGSEAIEFGVPGSGRVARYTQPTRRRFLTASQRGDFPMDGVVVGQVTALDTDALTLTITLLSGRKIPAAYTDDAITPDLKEVFDRRDTAAVVVLDCAQIIAPDETVKRVDDIRGLEVFLGAEDVPGRARLLELLQLQQGWLDGEGEPPDLLALEQTRDLLRAVHESDLPVPGVFPRPDGSIQIQWMTETDVWTAHVVGDGPITVDYLEVTADAADEREVLTAQDAAAFFAERQQQSRRE